jgi:O-acetyl-ADP-ribose deacetylase (regulator of RNase III)
MLEFRVGLAKISLMMGDITAQDTDAIVNAANSSLLGGGGVDGAIHRIGGIKILEECKKIRLEEWPDGLPTGKAVITSGGNLKARHVIHTVGPIWRGGKNRESELLIEAYKNSLELAISKNLKSIAFPSISTGAYRFPIGMASKIALKSIVEVLQKNATLEKVVLVLFSQSDLETYQRTAREIFTL